MTRVCAFLLTDAHFKLVISLMWASTCRDSMSRIMPNPCTTGLCDADKQREINNVLSTMVEGEMKAYKTEVEKLLKLQVIPRTLNKGHITTHNLRLLFTAMLPSNNAGCVWLDMHHDGWVNFKEDWESHQTVDSPMNVVKVKDV